jgi:hypothetical protein
VASRKIDNLLSPRHPSSSALTRLLGRAAQQDAWTSQLRALLPQEVAAECRVANVRDQLLTVHINSAAWATRLRFLIPALLPGLNRLADFSAVSEVRLAVVPIADGLVAPQRAQTVRPPDQASLLELADGIDHADLRDAILRLAARGQAQSSTFFRRRDLPEDGPGK